MLSARFGDGLVDKYFAYLVMLTIVDLFDRFEFFVLCFAYSIFHDNSSLCIYCFSTFNFQHALVVLGSYCHMC